MTDGLSWGAKRAESISEVRERESMVAVARYISFTAQRKAAVVYFFACGDFVKIGHSYHPAKRLEKLQVATPYEITCLGVAAGGTDIERALHKKFDHLRHRGEWFRLTADLQSEINSLCEPPASSV
jgi:uncharacterized protein with von Willebrand factor type A (vWA) domain